MGLANDAHYRALDDKRDAAADKYASLFYALRGIHDMLKEEG